MIYTLNTTAVAKVAKEYNRTPSSNQSQRGVGEHRQKTRGKKHQHEMRAEFLNKLKMKEKAKSLAQFFFSKMRKSAEKRNSHTCRVTLNGLHVAVANKGKSQTFNYTIYIKKKHKLIFLMHLVIQSFDYMYAHIQMKKYIRIPTYNMKYKRHYLCT